MLPTLEDFGIDEKAVLVELSKETMAKLIAAEKTIERLRAALFAVSNHELRDHEDYEAIQDIATAALAPHGT